METKKIKRKANLTHQELQQLIDRQKTNTKYKKKQIKANLTDQEFQELKEKENAAQR